MEHRQPRLTGKTYKDLYGNPDNGVVSFTDNG